MGDSGNPANWPAAQAKPPSLAGAYSTNMMKVLVTLIAYEDWVGSHPNAALVTNYMMKGGNAYSADLSLMTELAKRGWHIDSSPSEIDWLGVTDKPTPIHIGGKAVRVLGHQAYSPGSLNVVIHERVGELLNDHEQIVGRSSVAAGKVPYSETLSQGPDGRWRIVDIYRLYPSGGLGSLGR